MIKVIKKENMGMADHGWLNSRFHFSFAEYFNPDNLNFGELRVLNDDLIEPGTGFDMHPHRDMEIISYVIDGELSHKDSMGNVSSITRGMVQYMSAGTGVMHSEYNLGDELARLLQIWIIPEKKGLSPNYGDYRFKWKEREGKWLHLVSNFDGSAPVKVHQDVNIFAIELEDNQESEILIGSGRQAYVVEIEGEVQLDDVKLNYGDAAELTNTNGTDIKLKALKKSHLLLIEMNEG